MEISAESVELPANPHEAVADTAAKPDDNKADDTASSPAALTPKPTFAEKSEVPPRSDTPSTQEQPSEYAASTSPTTPGSAAPHQLTSAASTAAATTAPAKPASRPAVPALPVIPALPKPGSKDSASSPSTAKPSEAGVEAAVAGATLANQNDPEAAQRSDATAGQPAQAEAQPAPAPVKVAPKLWTGLFAKPTASNLGSAQGAGQHVNGAAPGASAAGPGAAAGFSRPNASSQAEALHAYQIGNADKLAFLEPRGLINTGNMCYMNSVRHSDPPPSPFFLLFLCSLLIFPSRCCKFFCSAFLSMISWTSLARRPFIASRAKPPWSTLCKYSSGIFSFLLPPSPSFSLLPTTSPSVDT